MPKLKYFLLVFQFCDNSISKCKDHPNLQALTSGSLGSFEGTGHSLICEPVGPANSWSVQDCVRQGREDGLGKLSIDVPCSMSTLPGGSESPSSMLCDDFGGTKMQLVWQDMALLVTM